MVSALAWRPRAGAGYSRTEEPRGGSDLRSRRRQSGLEDRRGGGYPRRLRIRKRADFVRLQRGYRGKKTAHFIVILAANPGAEGRLGITVSRKVGCSVERNRVKRRVREFFRLHREELQPAHDLLVIARTGAEKLSYEDVETELSAALAR
jgi:ribonuclease P protein component